MYVIRIYRQSYEKIESEFFLLREDTHSNYVRLLDNYNRISDTGFLLVLEY